MDIPTVTPSADHKYKYTFTNTNIQIQIHPRTDGYSHHYVKCKATLESPMLLLQAFIIQSNAMISAKAAENFYQLKQLKINMRQLS